MAAPVELTSSSEKETIRIARDFAQTFAPGDVVAIEGDLGAGKTVFVRGIAEALGANPREVSSPTFALVHEYECRPPVRSLVHLDLYRLESSPRELAEIGVPEIFAADAVAVVEWPREALTKLCPPTRLVRIAVAADASRRIRLETP